MNVKKLTVINNTPQEPYRFTKRIGSTVYEVNVYFNQDANISTFNINNTTTNEVLGT